MHFMCCDTHRAWQLYFIEGAHQLGHPMTAAVLRTAREEMHCVCLCVRAHRQECWQVSLRKNL
jgi:hypothetical protein